MPLSAGERLTTKADFATLLRAGGVGILQPSLGRLGGLLEARKIAALGEGFGALVAPHLHAGPIALSAAILLAASIPNFLVLETIADGGGFHSDLLNTPIRFEDGHVIPPETPGLGVEIDEAVARAHPWTGDRLHLEMRPDAPDPRGRMPFGGG